MKILAIMFEVHGHPFMVSAEHLTEQMFGRVESFEMREANAVYTFTARERQVLDLLANGAPRQEISETLHISKTTAITYTRAIMNKLHIKKRSQVPMVLRSLNISKERENGH